MSAIDRNLANLLYEVRGMLWANAHRRHFGGRTPNIGVSLRQLRPEVTSLRKRVDARVNGSPAQEARAIARLMPLPNLEHWVVPALAEAVIAGRITTDQIQSWLLTSEFNRSGDDDPALPEPRAGLHLVPAAAATAA